MNFQSFLPAILLSLGLLSGCNGLATKPSSATASSPQPNSEATVDLEMSESLSATAEDWFQKGNELLDQNQSLMAIEAYHRALQLDKTHTRAWHNLGLIYLQRATIAFENLVKQSTDEDVLKERGEYVLQAMQEILTEGFD